MQPLNAEQLKTLVEQQGILGKIKTRSYKGVLQDKSPARIPGGGMSHTISFYEEEQYICTIHKIITPNGKIFHCHVKDAFINGKWYKTKP